MIEHDGVARDFGIGDTVQRSDGIQRNYFHEVVQLDVTGNTLSDFQVKANVNLSGNPRFWQGNSEQPHWKEAANQFWVRVGIIPGKVLVYHGNTFATSKSNPEQTFEFYDGFENLGETVWQRYGDVISDVTTAEPSVIYDTNPQILTNETYVYKMWYRYGWSTAYLYYAESTDGINWVKYSGNPILTGYYQPFVFKYNNTYYLFASQYDSAVGASVLYRFHSTDGINWVNDGKVLDEGTGGVANTFVWVENGTWYMLYEYGQGVDNRWKIGLATSTDGLSWTKSSANPVISTTGSCSGPFMRYDTPKFSDGYYYLWVHCSPSGTLPTDIYRYRSTDLINWENQGMVFPRKGTDEGEGSSVGQVADVTMWEIGGKVYMYYFATSNGTAETDGHIKLAIANMTFEELITKYGNVPLPGWVTSNASRNDLYVKSGNYSMRHYIGSNPTWDTYANINTSVDFIIDCWLRNRAEYDSTTRQAYIRVGSDTNNYVEILWDCEGAASMYQQLNVVINGVATTSLQDTSYLVPADTWWHSKIIISGNNVIVYGDTGNATTLRWNVTDSNITSINFTKLYLSSRFGATYFDDIVIRKYASPEPTVTELGRVPII